MDALTLSETYNVPVEELWQALTNQEKMKIWYFDISNFKLERGFVFEFYEPGEERKYLHRCEILDFKPNSFLKHTWTHPEFSNGITEVHWEMEELNNETHLKFSHIGLENIADAGEAFQRKNYEEGWKYNLEIALRQFLEGK